jgi:hypothetical protein
VLVRETQILLLCLTTYAPPPPRPFHPGGTSLPCEPLLFATKIANLRLYFQQPPRCSSCNIFAVNVLHCCPGWHGSSLFSIFPFLFSASANSFATRSDHPTRDASPACPERSRGEREARAKDPVRVLSPLQCAVRRFPPVSLLECAVTKKSGVVVRYDRLGLV